MTPNFPETNEALYHTLTYFKIGRISDQIKKMGGELNMNYLDSWYNVALRSHVDMENELNQNAIGAIHFVQLSLFEYVKSWLDSWHFNSGFESEIESLIDIENKRIQQKYEEEIEKDKIEYAKTIPPGIAEGEVYVIEIPERYSFITKGLIPAFKELKVNRFETNKKPDLIDKSYLPEYLRLMQRLIDSFRNHSEKYVKRFYAGQMPVNAPLTFPPPVMPLLTFDSPSESLTGAKIQVELTAPQLLYLFKALKDVGVVKNSRPTDMLRAISTAFKLVNSEEEKDLSLKHLQNTWSNLEGRPAGFWADKFIEMSNQARKDNPNKLK